MYIKCLKADFEDDIIIAGIRAMGIIGQHISSPLMKMVESDIHVLDTDKYYARLHKKINDWMMDPSPLVNDTALYVQTNRCYNYQQTLAPEDTYTS